ncbi:dipeptide ABC transporter ATP-binding protein [Allosediminivita pacifica]|uniref:Peptide/nickel transport system ATP-binding protein n=1 Tax=Allosediminivita pacifica TaxID=1267769 RepID=A0A2T6ANU3_9RHOB|nr:ABC transporter ATP-binding protein [Allosediminivita pacifica]PTX45485.1 peptide/nickel transport system ATP-binding protein [Allosediminivita pacifica]GGB19834.1 putative ABC transporter ATP-binding protein [Allosediminivita pacifica]
MPMLEIDNLSVTLDLPAGPLHAVRDVSLSLDRGESLGIVGESGSGKSMSALALMRLLPRRARMGAGAIRFDDVDLGGLDDATFAGDYLGPKLGMIFQEPMTSLNPVYRIGRQLTEASVRGGKLTASAARRRAIELLDRVGIPEPEARMAQYPHQLSGGQRQRVMIAMALMMEPDLLIADEPTTALDVTVQAQIMELLEDLRREMGMGMILITHDLAVVARNVDRVAVMYGGEVVEAGDAARVLHMPRHPYTRALLGAIPRTDGPARKLEAIPGTVPSLYARPEACVFGPRCPQARPECQESVPPVRGDSNHWRRCVLAAAELRATQHAPEAIERARADVEEIALEAKGVTRVFRSRKGPFGPPHEIRAVDDVNLDVKRGEILALVGESGSGKSTLARMLLGLDAPTTGEILLDGTRVSDMAPMDRAGRVQPIFQDPYSSLNPRRTLAEIIARPLALRGEGDARSRRRKACEMMELVRLPDRLLHSYPSQLSGGQRQRVAIARALVTDPRMLVCDEPTSALDVSVQAQILNLLVQLQRDLGLTCLLITHDMAVVHQVATRVAVMLNGRLIEAGPADEVLTNPATDYTKRLLAAAPRFERDDAQTRDLAV